MVFLRHIFLFFILILAGPLACSFWPANPVVLQINDQKWTGREFAKLLSQKVHRMNIQDLQTGAGLEELKQQLITDLLLRHLVEQWAKARSVSVSPAEVRQEIQKIKNSWPGDKVFYLYLRRKKTKIKEWENHIKFKLLNQKVLQKIGAKVPPPSLEEMKEYYQNHLALFQVRARILVYHAFHEKKSALKKIRALVKKGETLPSAVRQFVPQVPARDLKPQWMEKGTLKVFDQAFSLKKGQISPVWQSDYGWHLIQMLKKKPAGRLSFEKARPEIEHLLTSQRQRAIFTKWVDEQGKKVKVLKNKPALQKIKLKLL